MARIARVVAPGMPHHITQRGIDRQTVFTSDAARLVYLNLLRENADRHQLRILGYCLMTNHVHILAVPAREDSMAETFRYTHGRFAQYANASLGRCGHFWQNRFFSCPIEDRSAGLVLSYIELNPVRARIVAQAGAFPWSSAAPHLGIREDATGMLDLGWSRQRWTAERWAFLLAQTTTHTDVLRKATYTGRPFGSDLFVTDLETRLGRRLERQKGGRPKRKVLAA